MGELLKQVNILCVVVFMSVLMVGCGGSYQEAGRYYNKKYDFSMKIPSGWKEQKAIKGLNVQFVDSPGNASVGIAVIKDASQTAKDYLDKIASGAERLGANDMDKGEDVIDGSDAYWYSAKFRGQRTIIYAIKKDDLIYGISIDYREEIASDYFEAKMRTIAETFRFE